MTEIGQSSRKHLYWLDWIRFLSAFAVLLGHSRFQHWALYENLDPAIQNPFVMGLFFIPRLANEAVTVFFVLSGYLVGGKLIESAINGKLAVRNYCIDRSVRIYLPLIPAVVLTWAVTVYRGEYQSWAVYVGNAIGVQEILVPRPMNNGSLWSLSYEIWFYILGLFCALLVIRRASGKVSPVVLTGFMVSFSVFCVLSNYYLFSWLIGAFGYFLRIDRHRLFWACASLFVFFAGCLMSTLTGVTSLNFGHIPLPPQSVSFVILSVGAVVFISSVISVKPQSQITRSIENTGCVLAAFSYTLYLVHRPILKLWSLYHGDQSFVDLSMVSVGWYLVKLISCLLVALIFWWLFERNTDYWRRRIKARFVT